MCAAIDADGESRFGTGLRISEPATLRLRTSARCSTTAAIDKAISTTLVADARPGLPVISLVKRLYAVVARTRALPPTIAGVPKSAIDSTNVSRPPALTAGKTSGSVTAKKRRHGPAPRPSAASSTDGLIVERLDDASRNTNG